MDDVCDWLLWSIAEEYIEYHSDTHLNMQLIAASNFSFVGTHRARLTHLTASATEQIFMANQATPVG